VAARGAAAILGVVVAVRGAAAIPGVAEVTALDHSTGNFSCCRFLKLPIFRELKT